MKKLLFSTVLFLGSFLFTAQNVNIPDINFKKCLVENSDINTNGDNNIQVSEAIAYTGMIDTNSYPQISNLKGIEAFVNITQLICSNNLLSSLNLSKNLALFYLDCSNNVLTSLNLSKNTSLTHLDCNTNELSSLSLVPNIHLERLICDGNLLTSLNLAKNTKLDYLSCENNQLTDLNLSQNTKLTYFSCNFNEITTLDLSQNTLLATVSCEYNQLTALNVKNLNKLNFLYCDNNNLTTLSCTTNTSLISLYCNDNALNQLNVQNSTNNILAELYAERNPNLFCIQVDDPNIIPTNWFKDSQANYNLDCAIFLENKEFKSKNISVYPNPVKSIINFSAKSEGKLYNMAGQKVATFKNVSQLNVENFEKGIYLLILSDKNGKVIQRNKVIKE